MQECYIYFSLVTTDDRKWKINQLPFADDTALVTDSEDKLDQLVSLDGCVLGKIHQ